MTSRAASAGGTAASDSRRPFASQLISHVLVTVLAVVPGPHVSDVTGGGEATGGVGDGGGNGEGGGLGIGLEGGGEATEGP